MQSSVTTLPETIAIARPDPALLKSAADIFDAAQSYEITSVAMYEAAATDLQEVKSIAKAIEAKRTSITGPINEALRAVNGLFKPASDFCAQAERVLKTKMLAWQDAEEKKRREEQARLDEIARKERERLEKAAAKAEASGKVELADAKREQAAAVPSVVVAPAPTKVSGVATRSRWVAECQDKRAFLKAALERDDLLAMVEINEGALNKLAGAMKSAMSIPGYIAKEVRELAARAA